MAAPGHGKTWMVCRTAPRRPVHVWDIDNKLVDHGWAQKMIEAGDLTAWTMGKATIEESLKARLEELGAKQHGSADTDILKRKLKKQPLGVQQFSDMMFDIEKDEAAMRAGSWFLDSATFLNDHVKTQLMYTAQRNKYGFDQWSALLMWWRDSMQIISDTAKKYDKDLFVSVHERNSETPGDKVTGVRYEQVTTGVGDEKQMSNQRTYVGQLDPVVLPSIDGQFAQHMGSFFHEVYHLYPVVTGDVVTYKCRVKPDGKRPLRTSFDLKETVHDPDFRKIWGVR
jgi:hypothetical protein